MRVLALLAAFFVASCGGGGGGGGGDSPPVTPKWTYMVYMSADNNLSDAAIADLNEMEAIGSTGEVNVVVMVEFSTTYSDNPYGGSTPVTLRGRIAKDTNAQIVSSALASAGGNLDMGAPATLTGFINWAKANYPAEHYALALWSHGGGWRTSRSTGGAVRGALQDETAGSLMSLSDIAQAIAGSGQHFDLINFDACLMAMYEVAYEMRALADFLVGSEEIEPGDGDPYHTILADLTAAPTMSGMQFAQVITQRYQQFYQSSRDVTTKSALTLSGVTNLDVQLRELADYSVNNIDALRPAVQSARDGAMRFNSTNRDLGDFLELLAAATSDAGLQSRVANVQAALGQAVLSNEFGPTGDNAASHATGLAIFLPAKTEVTQQDLTAYGALTVGGDTGVGRPWAELVNTLVTGDAGTQPQSATGNFAICIVWDDPSIDVDLYVYEPRPDELYAPWMGSTTPNGFFSGDSVDTGEASECYAAAESVEQGAYDVFINYFDGAASTVVETYYYDQASGPDFQLIDTATMSSSNPSPSGTNPIDDYASLKTNPYSDWRYPGSTTRAISAERQLDPSHDSESSRRAFAKRRQLQKTFGDGGEAGSGGKGQ